MANIGTEIARASFLQKALDKFGSPMDYRVLRILSCLYRRWASIRLTTMQDDGWIEGWADPAIGAGAEAMGATDTSYQTNALMEWYRIKGLHFCGGTADISEFFHQINRILLYLIAKKMGMPIRILDTYI